MTNPCEVTQEDRDAACAYLSEIAGLHGKDAVTKIRDDHPCLLAFARHRQSAQTSQPTPVADEGRREAMSVAEAKLLALVSTMHTAWMEREDAMTRPYTDHFAAIERMADLMDQIVDKVPELRRLTDAILATLPRAVGEGWQDISSAPKDGTRVILGGPKAVVCGAAWLTGAQVDPERSGEGGILAHLAMTGWKSADQIAAREGNSILTEAQFTHWMPLPAAPVDGGEGE